MVQALFLRLFSILVPGSTLVVAFKVLQDYKSVQVDGSSTLHIETNSTDDSDTTTQLTTNLSQAEVALKEDASHIFQSDVQFLANFSRSESALSSPPALAAHGYVSGSAPPPPLHTFQEKRPPPADIKETLVRYFAKTMDFSKAMASSNDFSKAMASSSTLVAMGGARTLVAMGGQSGEQLKNAVEGGQLDLDRHPWRAPLRPVGHGEQLTVQERFDWNDNMRSLVPLENIEVWLWHATKLDKYFSMIFTNGMKPFVSEEIPDLGPAIFFATTMADALRKGLQRCDASTKVGFRKVAERDDIVFAVPVYLGRIVDAKNTEPKVEPGGHRAYGSVRLTKKRSRMNRDHWEDRTGVEYAIADGDQVFWDKRIFWTYQDEAFQAKWEYAASINSQ